MYTILISCIYFILLLLSKQYQQHERRHLPTVHTVPWDSRKSSLSPGVKLILRSRRWQFHFHRNKQILRVGREVSETVWVNLKHVNFFQEESNTSLILWGTQEEEFSSLHISSTCFLCFSPSLLIYLQVLLTVNAVHKYLFLLCCFQPSFNYSWSEDECQRGGQTETLEVLRLPNIRSIRCATSLRVEGVSCHNQYKKLPTRQQLLKNPKKDFDTD